jgi:hypothetical protein
MTKDHIARDLRKSTRSNRPKVLLHLAFEDSIRMPEDLEYLGVLDRVKDPHTFLAAMEDASTSHKVEML